MVGWLWVEEEAKKPGDDGQKMQEETGADRQWTKTCSHYQQARRERKKSFSVLTVTRDGLTGQEVIEATTPGGHVLRDRKLGRCGDDEEQIVIRELQAADTTEEYVRRHAVSQVLERAAAPAKHGTTRVVRVDHVGGLGAVGRGGGEMGGSSRSYDVDTALSDENVLGGQKLPDAARMGSSVQLISHRSSKMRASGGEIVRSVSDVEIGGAGFGGMEGGAADERLSTNAVSWGRHFHNPNNPVSIALSNEKNTRAFRRLNSIIQARSRRSELVIMNLPDMWDHTDPGQCVKYLRCAETLVDNIDRVLFVHGSGHEVFDIGA
eukprot:g11870.t1